MKPYKTVKNKKNRKIRITRKKNLKGGMQRTAATLARTGKQAVNKLGKLGKRVSVIKKPVPPAPVISRFGAAGEGAVPSAFSISRFAAAGEGAAPSLEALDAQLSRAPLAARLSPAPLRQGRKFTREEAESISTTREIRALLEELQEGSSAQFPAGTRATTMRPHLMELLEARGRIYNPTVAERNIRRAILNETIPRTAPEFAGPREAIARTPISDEVGRFASEGGIEAGESGRLFAQATEDAQALVDEVIPLNGRNLLTPIEEQGGQTAAEAAGLLPELPAGERPTAAEIEAILDSIFPARLVGRALELGPQNIARQRGVQRAVMPQRNVNAYNEQIRDLVSVVLVHTPGAQVRQFIEVFTPQRLTRLKASLGAYFLRNPLDARLILDELFSILPRAKYNGAILDNLITNLAAQPERALAELIRASSAIQGAELERGQIQALTFAKGMGWFAARGFYTLLAAGLGILGLFIAAWTNINSTEDLAREIRINRELFDARFPGVAEFRDRAALFFQGTAAAIMDALYELRGIPRPPPAPAPAPVGPPAVVHPSPEVWAWARYIGEYARMLRDLRDVVLGRRLQ